jgi:uncharacterized protein YlzI (FlbEa/FlbD family)
MYDNNAFIYISREDYLEYIKFDYISSMNSITLTLIESGVYIENVKEKFLEIINRIREFIKWVIGKIKSFFTGGDKKSKPVEKPKSEDNKKESEEVEDSEESNEKSKTKEKKKRGLAKLDLQTLSDTVDSQYREELLTNMKKAVREDPSLGKIRVKLYRASDFIKIGLFLKNRVFKDPKKNDSNKLEMDFEKELISIDEGLVEYEKIKSTALNDITLGLRKLEQCLNEIAKSKDTASLERVQNMIKVVKRVRPGAKENLMAMYAGINMKEDSYDE